MAIQSTYDPTSANPYEAPPPPQQQQNMPGTEPMPAKPSPFGGQGGYQFNGGPISHGGAIAGIADNVLRGIVNGHAQQEQWKALKLKKKSDDLNASYQADTQRLNQVAYAQYQATGKVDQNSPEYKQAASASSGSWDALQDFRGQLLEQQGGGKKKGKGKPPRSPQEVAADPHADPLEVAQAAYGVAQKIGDPAVLRVQSSYNSPQAYRHWQQQQNPYAAKIDDLVAVGVPRDQALGLATGSAPKTEEDRFFADYKKRYPNATEEDTLKAYSLAKAAPKVSKGMKVIGTETLPIGLQDQDTGQQYLPSQLGPKGDAPPEYKESWKTLQDAKAAKEAEDQHKEDARADRQARTIGAEFDRMGKSQEFQENMAQFRSDMTTYRGLDTTAKNSEEIVTTLNSQYAQPGNHAVADNELQNFYTTVVQKGGRKTAAELALTIKIGSFGMNMKQMAQKAESGELPDQLRKELLGGMKAVAKEQRTMADQTKPELPQVTASQGRSAKPHQATSKGIVSISDAMSLPKYKGKSKQEVSDAITAQGYTPQ